MSTTGADRTEKPEFTLSERGLTLPCPRCGQAEATFAVRLTDPSEVTCEDCEEDIAVDELRDLIRKWQPICVWLHTFPVVE
jgi:uncharacterized protein (DUF983 family)